MEHKTTSCLPQRISKCIQACTFNAHLFSPLCHITECEQLQQGHHVCMHNPMFLLKPIKESFIYNNQLFPDGNIVPVIRVQKYLICGLGLSDEPRWHERLPTSSQPKPKKSINNLNVSEDPTSNLINVSIYCYDFISPQHLLHVYPTLINYEKGLFS